MNFVLATKCLVKRMQILQPRPATASEVTTRLGVRYGRRAGRKPVSANPFQGFVPAGFVATSSLAALP
ncbi:MAG: hypothetical protein KF713_14940 [Turneriella sp.]|nr:hypothetical protein [Turneriella sp.]